MSIFSALFDQGKIYNFQQAFGVKDITTAEMQAAIRDWAQLYYQAEATPEEDPCQRIPVLVVSTVTRAVFSEYQADSDNEDAKRILLELGRVKGKAVQQALIGGQSFLKPIFGQGGLTFPGAVICHWGEMREMRSRTSARRSVPWRGATATPSWSAAG